MANIKPFDLTTANYAANAFPTGRTAGEYYFDPRANKWYRFVQVTIGGTNANSLSAMRPVYYNSYANGTCYTDQAGTDQSLAGVLLCTVTSTYYSWIQVTGVALVCVTNSLAAQRKLIPDPANGLLKVASAATDVFCGETMAAAGASASTVGATIIIAGH